MSQNKISGDLTLIKRLNKLAVISTIMTYNTISRADIAKQAKLNKATISKLVDELLEIKLIKEIGSGESTGGRRPILLTLNHEAGTIIGIDLQINHISVIVTNLNSKPSWTKQVATKNNSDVKIILNQIEALISEAISRAPQTPLGILGVGIGVPGVVDHNNGVIVVAPNLGWRNVAIKTHFENKFDLPFWVDNEANAASLAEMVYGDNKDYANIVYVSAGVGIGVGLILDGKQYRGAKGYSGEFGHMSIERHGLKCSCGNQGCWEMYASEKYFMSEIKKYGDYDTFTFSDFTTKEMLENEDVKKTFHEVGVNLGIGITNIINALNPDVVIIGNSLAEAGNLILEPIINTTESRIIRSSELNTEIKLTTLKDKPSALGAATMVFSHLLNDHSSAFLEN